MVEALALRIATAIKRAEPEKTASIEVMKFSLEGILNTLISLLLIGCIGWATGTFQESMLAIAAFAFLRFFAGGLHMQKAIHCSLLSTLLIATAPHIKLTSAAMIIIGMLTMISVLIFAPSNIAGHARIPSKYFIYLKLISAIIVASNFLLLNSTIGVVFAIQAVTIIRLKKEVRT